jgi:hypothetical protein
VVSCQPSRTDDPTLYTSIEHAARLGQADVVIGMGGVKIERVLSSMWIVMLDWHSDQPTIISRFGQVIRTRSQLQFHFATGQRSWPSSCCEAHRMHSVA